MSEIDRKTATDDLRSDTEDSPTTPTSDLQEIVSTKRNTPSPVSRCSKKKKLVERPRMASHSRWYPRLTSIAETDNTTTEVMQSAGPSTSASEQILDPQQELSPLAYAISSSSEDEVTIKHSF